jgi:hypothetical protein
MRFISSIILMLACGCDTREPRPAIPSVDLQFEETVSVPVRITARESAPSLQG